MSFASNPDMMSLSQSIFRQVRENGGQLNDNIVADMVSQVTTLMSHPLDESKVLTPDQELILARLGNVDLTTVDFARFPANLNVHVSEEQLAAATHAFGNFQSMMRSRFERPVRLIILEFFEAHPENASTQVPDTACLDALKRVYCVSNSGLTTLECSICLSSKIGTPLDEKPSGDCDVFVKLECGHMFDESCILEWFKHANTCPLCRSRVQ
jgi:hypothetical protein